MEYGGQDFVTTAPAATTEPGPIITPLSIVTLAPHQTSSSITTGASFSGSFRWLSMMNVPTKSIR